ncbi:MAG: DUF1801 domain-containing protein [Deltaproteobacteria bacterium]
MARKDVDAYLAKLDDAPRASLEKLRATILKIVPDAEEGIAYGMPAFKVNGKAVAGFGAFKKHLSYFPHSGTVLEAVGDAVAKYETSKGTLKFPVDKPLPKALVQKLIRARQRELSTQ